MSMLDWIDAHPWLTLAALVAWWLLAFAVGRWFSRPYTDEEWERELDAALRRERDVLDSHPRRVQHSDATTCLRCGMTWDTNDPYPPRCTKETP